MFVSCYFYAAPVVGVAVLVAPGLGCVVVEAVFVAAVAADVSGGSAAAAAADFPVDVAAVEPARLALYQHVVA